MSVRFEGELALVEFERFDLTSYELFLRAKTLPESQVTYDWRADRYTLSTPARFADRLGAALTAVNAAPLPLAAHLFDYQRWALELALAAKRFAAWFDTGLGKGPLILEWCRQVAALSGGRVLIIEPLAVIPQLQAESERFYGGALPLQHLRSRDELIAWCRGGSGLAITNYEKFIPGVIPELRFLAGLAADESSILRTGGGVIKWNLIKSARGIEYKLSCTATPAPNEAMEYASQAAFLEKLRSEGEILWTYFQRDKYGEWTVKPHAREAFYRFMTSWSLYLRDPKTFGFGDILASLPEPAYLEERFSPTPEQRAAMQEVLVANHVGLWADERVSVTVRQKLLQIARGFRYLGTGKERRVERIRSRKMEYLAAQIALALDTRRDRVLVWTTFDEEGVILEELLGHQLGERARCAVLDGRMSPEERVALLDAFRRGEVDVLISKPQLIGFGLNLQFVTLMVFCGFDDSFERRYQAVRRAYRFGQTRRLRVLTVFIPELEGMVFDNLRRKEARFLEEVAAQEGHYRAALGMGAPVA